MNALLGRWLPILRAHLSQAIDSRWQSMLDVDDVLQVTCLEAFLRIRQFEPRGNGAFQAWLLRIAENNLRDAVKELGRQKRPQPAAQVHRCGAGESWLTLVEGLAEASTTPSRDVARSERYEVLNTALRRMPPDYEHVVRLYDLEGRPVREVAAALGRSEGAVYMLRSRAHDCLRELLGTASRLFGVSE